MNHSAIESSGLTKAFGRQVVVDHIDLEVSFALFIERRHALGHVPEAQIVAHEALGELREDRRASLPDPMRVEMVLVSIGP